MKLINEIKKLWKKYGSEEKFKLYPVDCGGYDIDGAVMLQEEDGKLLLKFNSYNSLGGIWKVEKEFELIPKKVIKK